MHVPGKLDTYRLEHPVTVGAFSAVYRAMSERSGQAVAVKRATSAEGAAAVLRELAALRRLAYPSHPNIARLVDSGEDKGLPWLAIEWLAGGSLAQSPSEPWKQQRLLGLVHSVASALAYAHARGVVHADLCPANIGLNGEGAPVLFDFGSATDGADSGVAGEEDSGTLGYVAPERLLRRAWDSRADVYSLGCLWYELLTGRPVFASDTAAGLFRQHVAAAPIAPSERGVAIEPDLERLLLRSLEKDPRQRTARGADLVHALGSHLGLQPQPELDVPTMFRPRLQGRAAALAAMSDCLKSAQVGTGGAMVVTGAAGCGKTSFLLQVRATAGELGFRTLSGSAQEVVREVSIADSRSALSCFTPVLRLLAQSLSEKGLDQTARSELAPLAVFEPSLAARVPAPPAVSDSAFQALVFAALVKALGHLSQERPLLVTVDDVQFADRLTLQFLRSDALAGLRETRAVLVLGWNTSRSAPELSSAVEPIRLGPLPAPLVEAMVSDMLGTPHVDASSVALVQRATQGLPLAVSELMLATAQEQLWRRVGSTWTLTASSDGYESLEERIRARVSALPAPAPRMAALAAVLGDEFSIVDLERMALEVDGADADQVRSALEHLLLHQVVTRSAAASFRFAHGVYREVCDGLLEVDARRALHAALAKRLTEHPDARSLQKRIGLHLAAAGHSHDCIAPLRRAARAAASVHAVEDAIRLLQLAWKQALDACGSPTVDRLASNVAWELLRVMMRAADHDGLRLLAGELLERLPAERRLLRAKVLRLLALSHRVTGQSRKAQELLEQGRQLLAVPASSPLSLQRELLEYEIMRVSAHYSQRELGEAAAVLRGLRALARVAASPTQQAKIYMWHANVIALSKSYRYSRRAVHFERRAVAAYAKHQRVNEDYVMSQFDLGFMLLLGGPKECAEAGALLADAYERAQRLNDTVLSCRILTYRAVAERRMGRESSCMELANIALPAAVSSGLRGYVGAAHACLAWAALRTGDDLTAGERCRTALEIWNGGADAPLTKTAYPFQWLAGLPLLATRRNAEHLEACKPLIENLLSPSQARLHPELDHALERILGTWNRASEFERYRSVDAALRIAAQRRYL